MRMKKTEKSQRFSNNMWEKFLLKLRARVVDRLCPVISDVTRVAHASRNLETKRCFCLAHLYADKELRRTGIYGYIRPPTYFTLYSDIQVLIVSSYVDT